MRLSVIGTGYVGLVTGACFAEMGNDVTCVDVDEKKIEDIINGIIPIFEPNLDTMIKENYQAERLKFTTRIEDSINTVDVCFIAVGTPMDEDGAADLQYIINAAREIGRNMSRYLLVVDKSTVPVGSADKVRHTIQAELDKRSLDIDFDVVSNPEFLKEGTAVSDCMRPDRIIIGTENQRSIDTMKELYIPFIRNTENFIIMDVKSAEMTKYAANAMLATKISFINEIANICEKVGADVNKVRIGIGSDSRIGYSFIYPGCGYGGSCFPKDVKALIRTSYESGYTPKLLDAVETVNNYQKELLFNKITARFGDDLRGKSFAIWGLSFKPETDDCRESVSLLTIKLLTSAGATVKVYDPKAMTSAKYYLTNTESIQYCKNKYDALNDADALVLITEWKEFRNPDFMEMSARLKSPIIFDGRNQYSHNNLSGIGFEYWQVGVKI